MARIRHTLGTRIGITLYRDFYRLARMCVITHPELARWPNDRDEDEDEEEEEEGQINKRENQNAYQ